jgi:hypothetical protein
MPYGSLLSCTFEHHHDFFVNNETLAFHHQKNFSAKVMFRGSVCTPVMRPKVQPA